MTTLLLEDVGLSLPELLKPIERRAIALGIECSRHRGCATDGNWLAVEVVDGLSNTLGFFVVDRKLYVSLKAWSSNDPIALIENARKVADTYRRLMDVLHAVPALDVPWGEAS